MEETAKKLEALKLSDEEKKKLAKRHLDEFQKADTRLEQAAMNRMKREFAVDLEERTLMEEDVTFAPPKSLRSLTVVR